MNTGKWILQPTQKKFAKPFCDRAGCSIYSPNIPDSGVWKTASLASGAPDTKSKFPSQFHKYKSLTPTEWRTIHKWVVDTPTTASSQFFPNAQKLAFSVHPETGCLEKIYLPEFDWRLQSMHLLYHWTHNPPRRKDRGSVKIHTNNPILSLHRQREAPQVQTQITTCIIPITWQNASLCNSKVQEHIYLIILERIILVPI
jgi:hypothetical protein